MTGTNPHPPPILFGAECVLTSHGVLLAKTAYIRYPPMRPRANQAHSGDARTQCPKLNFL